jgi:putative heme transporter
VPPGEWSGIVALAVLNWIADLACLLAGVKAIGLDVPAGTVVTAHLVTQLARQIPLTPGGVGVVEASLIVGLSATGAAAAPVTAAVLLYRWCRTGWRFRSVCSAGPEANDARNRAAALTSP